MTRAKAPEWCRDPESLGDDELSSLVAAATAVIAEGEDASRGEAGVTDRPAATLMRELTGALAEEGLQVDDRSVGRLGMPQHDRRLAIELVRQVCGVPALRDEVEAANTARKRMMVIDPVTVLAVAVLVLVMKLRSVRVGPEGVEVVLDPVKEGMLSVVKDVLSG